MDHINAGMIPEPGHQNQVTDFQLPLKTTDELKHLDGRIKANDRVKTDFVSKFYARNLVKKCL